MPDSNSNSLAEFTVEVLLFGTLKDVVGAPTISIVLSPGATVADLLNSLAVQKPHIERYLPHVRVAVNYEYCDLTEQVNSGDEVAIIPPVAGG